MAVSGMERAPAAGTGTGPQPAQQPADNDKRASLYPMHPISQLQGPFEESILETDKGSSDWVVDIDAQTRRRDLLENDDYERLCGRKWRQRSAERYHPFWKLVSQMAFGAHLLGKEMAISGVQVMKILQTHVDELDGFLQRTTEDFLIIHLDVRTRTQYLRLPLGNLDVFDKMLEDRNFRLSLVTYNDQIEHAVTRFTLAITDALKDLSKGKDAMGALWHYIKKLADEGCFKSDNLKAFHDAMKENLEGWMVAMSKLRRRGASLQKSLGKLALSVVEIQRRVGVASRKDLRSLIKAKNSPNRNQSVKQRIFTKSPPRQSSNKPLPRDPLSKAKASQRAARKAGGTSPPVHTANNGDPNTATNSQEDNTVSKTINRAKSCSALFGEANAGVINPPPRTPGRLTRKFSKSFLSKQTVGENPTAEQNRPATAPARTLKSRSASMEQLKALWANGRPRTQSPMPKSPNRPRASPPADGSEKMKDQISHFLKTDRVVEAWENMASKTSGCRGTFPKPSKDWPCSIFRSKSPAPCRDLPENKEDLSGADLERQMSWVQDEPEVLQTYTLRQRPETSPRIHVLSVQVNLDEEITAGTAREETRDVSRGEAGPVITALPTVPPPTPTSISSIIRNHRPRMVDCA
ncbi:hypothetical protein N7492_004928 [Penicillium capsulatum]|uniref:Uncharacterized protein n=1 Tax=Penicillium capsulatum TaxID=69766 RepID=A0A9W9I8P9_9EURO|nr:hypothetical protein N7492_004928 [Penicillium capsulatum]KAJ6135966.1 hypothetical protein N7512_001126 [Penicillium capsulatum]